MAIATNEADEIRYKMGQIRRDLHADVREVVAHAEAATDWRRYIGMYPWAAVGVSVAVGYLIVPRRHKHVPASVHVTVPAENAAVREVIDLEKAKAKEPERKGPFGLALGFLTPIALRAAQGYAVQYLEGWIAQQQQAMAAAAGPSPVPGQPDPSGGAGRSQAKPPY